MKFTFPPDSRPLEGYTIKRAIHRGGFGEVYYAVSDAGREVALKLLQNNCDVELRGVQQCLNLSHPNLVTIFDVRRDDDGDHWVIMEYVAGETLDRVITRHPEGLPIEQVHHWVEGLTAGVAFLHNRGLVHRDLKPANVFSSEGTIKVGDIGLSKFITPSHRSAQTQSVGTVYYMAPEVAKGRYGKGVDIYALGVMLYEMLTGTVPFDGESTGEILMKHLSEAPDLNKLPPRLRPVVGRALAKDPEQRFASVIELKEAFHRAVVGRTTATDIPEAAFDPQPPPPPPPPTPPASLHPSQRPVFGGVSARGWIVIAALATLLAWRGLNPMRGFSSMVMLGGSAALVYFGIVLVQSSKMAALAGVREWLIGPDPRTHATRTVNGAATPGNRARVSPANAQPESPSYTKALLISIGWGLFGTLASRTWGTSEAVLYFGMFSVPALVALIAIQTSRSPHNVRFRSWLRRPIFSSTDETDVDIAEEPVRPRGETRIMSRSHHEGAARTLSMCHSCLAAVPVAALLTMAVALLTPSFFSNAAGATSPDPAAIGLFSLTVIYTSWGALFIGSIGKSRAHALWRLLVGAETGIVVYIAARYLMFRWPSSGDQAWSGWFSQIGEHSLVGPETGVSLAGCIVFFTLLMLVGGWSRQTNPRRWTSLSIFRVLFTGALAWCLSKVFVFPHQWAFVTAAAVSSTVQLVSPWTGRRSCGIRLKPHHPPRAVRL